MAQNRKTPLRSEEICYQINDGSITLPPVSLECRAPDPTLYPILSGTLTARLGSKSCDYEFEYTRSSTPKAIEEAMLRAEGATRNSKWLPLVMAPYLSEERLDLLRQREISGLDLCGNAVLIAPDISVWRSGRPNLYASSDPIKNVYRGSAARYGLNLKQSYLQATGARLLIPGLQPERATRDQDFFLEIQLFERRRNDIRALLDRLGYTAKVANFQFVVRKPDQIAGEIGAHGLDLGVASTSLSMTEQVMCSRLHRRSLPAVRDLGVSTF